MVKRYWSKQFVKKEPHKFPVLFRPNSYLNIQGQLSYLTWLRFSLGELNVATNLRGIQTASNGPKKP